MLGLGQKLAGLLLCSAALLSAGKAAAQTPDPSAVAATTFSLQLTASGCPTTDAQLVTAISARVPTAERVEAGAEVAIVAEVSNGGTSSLTVSLTQGSSRRDFPGVSCDEAAAVIAFIAALVLDARPEERLKATELAALPEPAAAPPNPQKKPAPATKPVEPAPQPAKDRRDRIGAMARGEKPRFGVSGALALETAVAPTPPLAGLFGIHLRWQRASWWSPELRAELLVTGTSTEAAKAGNLRLSLMAGRLSACPLRLRAWQAALHIAPCATFDAGSLHAQGDSSINGHPNPMPWLAGGVSLRTDVSLSRAFELELLLGVKLLAHHDRFTLDPDATVIYTVPPFSAGFSLGLGFQP